MIYARTPQLPTHAEPFVLLPPAKVQDKAFIDYPASKKGTRNANETEKVAPSQKSFPACNKSLSCKAGTGTHGNQRDWVTATKATAHVKKESLALPSSRSETLKELKLRSLEALLPAACAFLCMQRAASVQGRGVLLSDFARLFNETFGKSYTSADTPFMFREDAKAVVDLLYEVDAFAENDEQLYVGCPEAFLKLKKTSARAEFTTEDAEDASKDACEDEIQYETEVPKKLLSYVIGRKGEHLKEIYRNTGVGCIIVHTPQQIRDSQSCMLTVKMHFGRSMLVAKREAAANRALECLRRLFVRLYDSFALQDQQYVYPRSNQESLSTSSNASGEGLFKVDADLDFDLELHANIGIDIDIVS